MPAVIAIVGRSDSGKTTLIERLIPELRRRGYRIGTVKHAHGGFEMDRRGKDSWRHRAAGAEAVMIASPGQVAVLRTAEENGLGDVERWMPGVDLILAEGYKRTRRPKIEVLRAAAGRGPVCAGDDSLVALVTDTEFESRVPRFGLEEVARIADLIEENYL